MKYTMTVNNGRNELNAFGRTILVSCKVRNLENGLRRVDQVVFGLNGDGSQGKAVSPQVFPQGIWAVGKPRAVDPAKDVQQYKQPYFIPTDAYQDLPAWSVHPDPEDGLHYEEKTAEVFRDWGYGLHFSKSATTLGCLKVESRDDLMWLVEEIKRVQANGDTVRIAVAANIEEEEQT